MYALDTIVAMITPAGVGGVSVVRVSGVDAFSVSSSIIRGLDVCLAHANTVHYCRIVGKDGDEIDDVVVSVFREPHSYTGEDVVEIGCHGNPRIVERVIARLLDSGARRSGPGEFTLRAFLNGRIDLAQAEAVANVIAAESDAALSVARRQLHGELSNRIRELADELVRICALIELDLDFVEEGFVIADREVVANSILGVRSRVKELISTYERGKLNVTGITVAIVGKPNVGKSSLLNRLAGESRAIVSTSPGTTRDEISIAIQHDGIRMEFWDTAGLRDAASDIERAGIGKTLERIDRSDVLAVVVDGSLDQTLDDLELQVSTVASVSDSRVVLVVNKSDLTISADVRTFADRPQVACYVSARTGDGVEKFLDFVRQTAFSRVAAGSESVMIANSRHRDCLVKCESALDHALTNGLLASGEFLSIDIRSAIDSLGEVIGRTTPEEILDSVFSQFCIGK